MFPRAVQSSKYTYRKEWQEKNPRTFIATEVGKEVER